MKPFEEDPALFTNGQFHVISDDHHGLPMILEGYDNRTNTIIAERINFDVATCQLVARKISDMTAEELQEAVHVDSPNLHFDIQDLQESESRRIQAEQIVKRKAYGSGTTRSADLHYYLRSRGVYPFNNVHFNEGKVVDINSI